MTKGLADVEEGGALGGGHGGEGVPQSVEGDFWHVVSADEPREGQAHRVGGIGLPMPVQQHHAGVVPVAVGPDAGLLLPLLLP